MTPLLLLNALLLTIGTCGCPLVMRLYFLHGGHRLLSSFLETGGWPINFIPLRITYLDRRSKHGPTTKPILIKSPVFLAATVISLLTGVDDYLNSYGVAKLPVSTSALIIAPSLAYRPIRVPNGGAEVHVVLNQRGFPTDGGGGGPGAPHDRRPAGGESKREYYAGFFLTLLAAALYGFVLPLVELTYKKAKQAVTYTLVLEIQLVMC
ncbi:hypothetical protein RHSIM_Rhsim06G0075500 [Rhododendron simsii]|uniref:Uncharacterized protein n=1 Tax=Rhododendron simsii TaxID=118357 RepID=A0A834LKP4_RHOSS|nr:hypothetical protein RHSIM_Rhsim06G0075500 [Rhododendron simsii]